MKRRFLSFLSLCISVSGFSSISGPGEPVKHKQGAAIAFTENKGQVHDQNYQPRPDVLYGAMAGDLAVHIKKNGISYQLFRIDQFKETVDGFTGQKRMEAEQQTLYRIDLTWVNCEPAFKVKEEAPEPGYVNYYTENCPNGALRVKSYRSIVLQHLYKGIDLHYYEKNGELKHDYIVASYADYRQIQLKVEGAEIAVREDGSLLLTTPLGCVEEGSPVVFQNGKQLSSRWIINNNILSFKIDGYDEKYELIIDPVTRLWGTYYGGSSLETAYTCTTDGAGNVFMTGSAPSVSGTVIATTGSHQSTYGGGIWADAFLAKFNATGVRQWATYYGGNTQDYAYGCATDASGNIYMAGTTEYTQTPAVIATPGTHQVTNGGYYDCFLVKFDAGGTRQWGTFYGGIGYEVGWSCATDTSGNVFLTGRTESASGISTTGAHQTVHGGNIDGFVVKFNSNGTRLWGTYYGGVDNDVTVVCTTDLPGNIYLAGLTLSSNGISTPGVHQPVIGGTVNHDAFLAKLDANGVRQWGTYYGSSAEDVAYGCAADGSGNVYLTGHTSTTSGTVIATIGSHQPAYGGSSSDVYLAKFTANGSRLWGTYLGGFGIDKGFDCSVDLAGNVYVAGYTDSGNGIGTSGTPQPTNIQGLGASFLTKFDGSGSQSWGTYYGGGYDQANSCAVDLAGYVFLAGISSVSSGTQVASSNGHQAAYGGASYDAYLAKFDACVTPPAKPAAISGPASTCPGILITFTTLSAPGVNAYTMYIPGGSYSVSTSNSIVVTPVSSGIFSLVAGNSCGASAQQTVYLSVHPLPTITLNNGAICAGESFTLTASGANTFTYSSGPVVTPPATTSYSVSGTSINGCTNTAVSTVSVNPNPSVNVSTTNTLLCAGETVTITAAGASSMVFSPGGAGPAIVVTPTSTSIYSVTGTDANGCSHTALFTQSVDLCSSITGHSATEGKIVLYPNPTGGLLHLELDSDKHLTVLNITGQIVYNSLLCKGKHHVDLSDSPPGVYLLILRGAIASRNIKVIIE